jgi:hypothetical protein
VNGAITGTTLGGTINTALQPNITQVGTLTNLTVSNNVTANSISSVNATINNLSGLTSLTLTGAITGTTLGGTINTALQPNITQVGTLTDLTVSGNVVANNISSVGGTFGNLSVPGTITGGTFSGTLGAGTLAGITSLGNLTALTVNGNITSNAISTTNATIGNLSGLTSLTVNGAITGTTLGGIINTAIQPYITQVGALINLTVSNNVTANSISTVNATINNLSGLTSLTVNGAITGTTLGGTINTALQPNITQVGALTDLTVSGNVVANNISSVGGSFGNLSVPGTITGGVFSGTLAPITLSNITTLSNLSSLTVSGQINSNTISGTLVTSSQPNITTLGTLSNLTISGNINVNNISSVGGAFGDVIVNGTITSGLLSGTLSSGTLNTITSLSNLNAATVSGNVSANTLSGTLTTDKQPNIKSVGNLTGLSVTGDVVVQGNLSVTGSVSFSSQTFSDNFTLTGTSFMKWGDGSLVPAKGKSAIELILEGSQKSIAPTYTLPTLTLTGTPTGGAVEIGTSLNINFSGNFIQNDGGSLLSILYKKDGASLGSNTDNVTLTSTVSYTADASYSQGQVKNDNLGQPYNAGRIAAGVVTSNTIQYMPQSKRYWGYLSSNNPSSSDILSILGGGTELSAGKAKSSFTINISSGQQHIYYAYPKDYGDLTKLTIGGFGSLDAFTRMSVTVTNAQGYSREYWVYISISTFSQSIADMVTE